MSNLVELITEHSLESLDFKPKCEILKPRIVCPKEATVAVVAVHHSDGERCGSRFACRDCAEVWIHAMDGSPCKAHRNPSSFITVSI